MSSSRGKIRGLGRLILNFVISSVFASKPIEPGRVMEYSFSYCDYVAAVRFLLPDFCDTEAHMMFLHILCMSNAYWMVF